MTGEKSSGTESDRLLKKDRGTVPNYRSVLSKREQDAAAKALIEEEDEKDEGNALVIAFVLMIVFQLGNRIFGRLMTYPMHNYPSFVNILSVAVYVPMCFIYIWPMQCFGAAITKEQTDIPKYKFAVMGAYDSIAGIMQTFAVNFISNAGTIVLVQQSAIPISMGISFVMLGAKYDLSQYIGAGIVLFGIVVVLVPQMCPSLLDNDIAATAASTDVGVPASMNTSSTSELVWILILVISCVPMCLSSVYKEKALGEMEIDVVYLNGWVAIYQFLMAIPLIFPSSLAINLPMDEILPNMYGGWKCWLGEDTIVEGNTAGLPADHCTDGPFYVTLYIFFNIVYNALIVVILKHGSSNVLWLSSTVIVPLSNIAFSLDFMPGHQPLTEFDVVGLIVIMGGLIVYRFSEPIIGLYTSVFGDDDDDFVDEMDAKLARIRGKKVEGKQTKFMGINQIEGIQSLFVSRVKAAARQALFRSPKQIREGLLLKLGIPPSPHVMLGPGGRQGSFIEIKPQNRQNSFVDSITQNRKIQPRSRSGSLASDLDVDNKI